MFLKITTASVVALAILCAIFYFKDSLRYRTNPSVPLGKSRSTVFFDRLRSQAGYNVINSYVDRPECVILDMEGNFVYEFPKGFCHFFNNGDLLILNEGTDSVQYYDASAQLLWEKNLKMHHDFDVSLDEEKIFILVSNFAKREGKKMREHEIFLLNRSGEVQRTWNLDELSRSSSVEFSVTRTKKEYSENFHTNSIQVLPPNPLERLDPAFSSGNLLVNCFQNDVILILDSNSGAIVWSYYFKDGIDENGYKINTKGAHTVKMIENGNLVFFHNQRGTKRGELPSSAAVELNPLTKTIEWIYESKPHSIFYSGVWGSAYRLESGNTLISNSASGSAFEITPKGRVVWEWINPQNDPYGMAFPVYRVTRVNKEILDPILKIWKAVK